MQEEIWKDIPTYEGLYQVSNLGNVKSLPKDWGNGRHNGKILKGGYDKYGYYVLSLYKKSKQETFQVQQLVAICFLNHKRCKYKFVVDHINDNPSDNRLENLQVITHRENVYKTQGKYTSKYKGVCWHKASNKWASAIYINGKVKHLGLFNKEEEAGEAYKNKINEITKR
jgi:hypothetical protein